MLSSIGAGWSIGLDSDQLEPFHWYAKTICPPDASTNPTAMQLVVVPHETEVRLGTDWPAAGVSVVMVQVVPFHCAKRACALTEAPAATQKEVFRHDTPSK